MQKMRELLMEREGKENRASQPMQLEHLIDEQGQAILADNTSYNLFNFSGDIGIGYTFVDKKIAMDIEPLFTKNLVGLLSGEVDANAFQSSLGLSLTIRH